MQHIAFFGKKRLATFAAPQKSRENNKKYFRNFRSLETRAAGSGAFDLATNFLDKSRRFFGLGEVREH